MVSDIDLRESSISHGVGMSYHTTFRQQIQSGTIICLVHPNGAKIADQRDSSVNLSAETQQTCSKQYSASKFLYRFIQQCCEPSQQQA
jgi:hypothetical protein